MSLYFQEEFNQASTLASCIDKNWENFSLSSELKHEFSEAWNKKIGYPAEVAGDAIKLHTSNDSSEVVHDSDLAKAVCAYPLYQKLVKLQALAKLTAERANVTTFKKDFAQQYKEGETKKGLKAPNWDKLSSQIDDDFSSDEATILKDFFLDCDKFYGIKGIGREDFTNPALCKSISMRADRFSIVHQVASVISDSIYAKAKNNIESLGGPVSSDELKKAFSNVCEFCQWYEANEAIMKNHEKASKCQGELTIIQSWIASRFKKYKSISFVIKHSTGSGVFPRVPWLTILAPGQNNTSGVYVALCFGRKGNGGVLGFAESATNRQGLPVVKRSKSNALEIDIKGSASTNYNDCFVNPKEFQPDNFDQDEFEQHFIESMDRYIEFLDLKPEDEIGSYGLDDVLTDLFINESEVQSIKDSLGTKKNVVLQGPPGVGKTFVAQRLAYYLIGQEKEANIGMVQFHQSYSYEDFIQGYRPTEKLFELKEGVFYRFCEEARKRPDEKFVFIIDEINRGNLSKIFGEIMMLIEADKREEKYAVKLTYAKNETDPFFVPENVHLLGLMNTADRSLAIVDYALRRRFRFFDIKPSFGESFKKHLSSKGVSNELIDKICSKIETLNNFIREDHRNLGEGFMIGHSYFCDPPLSSEDHSKWLSDIFNHEIVPLINEYWIDNKEVKEKRTSDLLDGLS